MYAGLKFITVKVIVHGKHGNVFHAFVFGDSDIAIIHTVFYYATLF